MGTHVALEVEVSKFVLLANLQKSRKFGIRVNLTSIASILEVVIADVTVNLASYLSASHLSAGRLSEELSKLISNKSWFYKTTWATVSLARLFLSSALLSNTEFASKALLKRTRLLLKRRYKRSYFIKFLEEVGETISLNLYNSIISSLNLGVGLYRWGLFLLSRSRSGGSSLSSLLCHYNLLSWNLFKLFIIIY